MGSQTQTVRQRTSKPSPATATNSTQSNVAADPQPPIEPSGRLLTWDELPHWLQDNIFIRGSYRPPSYSIPRSLLSGFQVHNETVNIQSHLLGALSFVFLAALIPTLPPIPVLPLLPFLSGAIACLTLSAWFHATSNVSPRVAQAGNHADYIGIIALIAGSFLSSVQLAFACDPFYMRLYSSLILALSAACAVLSLLPRFRTPAWRPIRAGLFVCLGLVAVVPFAHGLVRWGWTGVDHRLGATQVLAEGALYVSGAGLYAARWPERKWPGRFDIVGSSHQIFHVLVVAAAWCHFRGLMRGMAFMEGNVC